MSIVKPCQSKIRQNFVSLLLAVVSCSLVSLASLGRLMAKAALFQSCVNQSPHFALICAMVREGDLPYQLRMVCDGALETVQRLHVGKEWGETHVSTRLRESLVFLAPVLGALCKAMVCASLAEPRSTVPGSSAGMCLHAVFENSDHLNGTADGMVRLKL